MSLLDVVDLCVDLKSSRALQPVIRHVNFSMQPGQIVGLVGESGAGKSMIAKTILGLLPRTALIRQGQILFNGVDLLQLKLRSLSLLLGRKIALIPQDPLGSLNPVRQIGVQLSEGIRTHLGVDTASAQRRSLELLEEVLITEPKRVYSAYSHELSGGMRQRILIAMAFSCEPELIIADEPTTALDVTVQRRVLSLIRNLQKKRDTSLLFVTHDLGVVAKICDSVVVLFDGRILEQSDVQALFTKPQHAYTTALIEAMPRYDQPDKPIKPISDSLIARLFDETRAMDANQLG